MTSSRARRLAAASSIAALAALLGPLPSAAGRLCGTGSGKRPPTDATLSAATAVTAAGLSGPSCYTHGLEVALPSDAGNVTIEDVWVEGVGVAVTVVPQHGSLTLKDCRVSPTKTQPAVDAFTAVAVVPEWVARGMGILRLTNTVLDVSGDDWTSTRWSGRGNPGDVRRIAGLVCTDASSWPIDVYISGGAVRVGFADPLDPVDGLFASDEVQLVAENVSITVNVTSAAGVSASANAVMVWVGRGSGVHCHFRHVDIDVSCEGNDCSAAGATTHYGHHIFFRVADSTIQVVGGKQAKGIWLSSKQSYRGDSPNLPPVEIVRSQLTVIGPTSVALRSHGTLLISESVLNATGSSPAPAVEARGADVVLHRTVLSGLLGEAPLLFGSSLTRLVLVDVDVATPDAATGKCAVAGWLDAAGTPAVRVRGVRCGVPRAAVAGADVVAGLSEATAEAPGECGGGYVVGVVPTVSLDPALPPFRWSDIGSMCMKSGVNETATAIAPAARVSVVNVAATVTISNLSLGVLTIIGGVPAGATVELIGTSLGPQEAAGPSAEAVLEISGPLLGTLSLTGGAALRGGVHIAGDFGADALLHVDGASVETAENASALAVDGALRGELRLGASGATVFQGTVSAAPAELAKWRALHSQSQAGSDVSGTDTGLAPTNRSTPAAASGAGGLQGLAVAAGAGLSALVVFV